MVDYLGFVQGAPDPTRGLFEGIDIAGRIAQRREARAAAQQQREMAEKMQADLGALASNPNATARDYAAAMVKYPQLGETFKNAYDLLSVDQQEAAKGDALRLYAAVDSGNIDVAKDLLNERKEAALNAGNEQEAKQVDALMRMVEISPEAAKTTSALFLAQSLGEKEFAKNLEQLREGRAPAVEFRVLTEQEKTNLGLPKDGAFQINREGKISGIGGGGTKITLASEGQIPTGMRAVRDEEGRIIQLEAIPGGPLDQKTKDIAEQKGQQAALTERATNVVIEDIDRLRDKIEGASFLDPVTGVSGMLAAYVPGSRRLDAESLKETIVANIGFDRLQQMREASPTGGALGAVSERELSTLQAVLGNLSFSQSEEQLLENLDRLDKIYQGILKKAQAYPNAAEFGFVEETPEGDIDALVDRYLGGS